MERFSETNLVARSEWNRYKSVFLTFPVPLPSLCRRNIGVLVCRARAQFPLGVLCSIWGLVFKSSKILHLATSVTLTFLARGLWTDIYIYMEYLFYKQFSEENERQKRMTGKKKQCDNLYH